MKTIWVLCGGQSSEHDISLLSARNVVNVLSKMHYAVSVLYVTREASWYHISADTFLQQGVPGAIEIGAVTRLLLLPGEDCVWRSAANVDECFNCDLVFSVMHGQQGEDGHVQGLLNCLGLPFVGSDVLGSAICMAKHVAKSLLAEAGILTVPGVTLTQATRDQYPFTELQRRLGTTLFVKPAASGSSIGVTQVSDADAYASAISEAFRYDNHVLVEQSVVGREIECSVLGNVEPSTALPGEIIVNQKFYDYSAKYLDAQAALVKTPADLTPEVSVKVRELAQQVFTVLQCKGLARVDFFLTEMGELFVNEVNTLPGFTDISMYAKNWQVSGVSQQELFEKLIELALSDHAKKKELMRSFLGVAETQG